MTARVIDEGSTAEIIAVIEAEDRPCFFVHRGAARPKKPYRTSCSSTATTPRHRRRDHDQERVPDPHDSSNVDADPKGIVFSRDCPEYEVKRRPARLFFLSTTSSPRVTAHKPGTTPDVSRKPRECAEIYERASRRRIGKRIAVVGDFNDNPDAATLDPLIAGTDLKDCVDTPGLHPGRPHRDLEDQPEQVRLSAALARSIQRRDIGGAQPAAASGTGPRSRTRGRCSTSSPRKSRPHPTMRPSGPTFPRSSSASRCCSSRSEHDAAVRFGLEQRDAVPDHLRHRPYGSRSRRA